MRGWAGDEVTNGCSCWMDGMKVGSSGWIGMRDCVTVAVHGGFDIVRSAKFMLRSVLQHSCGSSLCKQGKKRKSTALVFRIN